MKGSSMSHVASGSTYTISSIAKVSPLPVRERIDRVGNFRYGVTSIMPIRSLLWVVVAVLGLAGPALVLPVDAHAAGGVSKKKRSRGKFVGHGVPQTELRT